MWALSSTWAAAEVTVQLWFNLHSSFHPNALIELPSITRLEHAMSTINTYPRLYSFFPQTFLFYRTNLFYFACFLNVCHPWSLPSGLDVATIWWWWIAAKGGPITAPLCGCSAICYLKQRNLGLVLLVLFFFFLKKPSIFLPAFQVSNANSTTNAVLTVSPNNELHSSRSADIILKKQSGNLNLEFYILLAFLKICSQSLQCQNN